MNVKKIMIGDREVSSIQEKEKETWTKQKEESQEEKK